MHGRFFDWLTWTLALSVLCVMTNVVLAQDGLPPAPPSNGVAAEATQPMPIEQPYAGQYYSASNAAIIDGDLAKRLADVEKALKKLDDKAKEDKAKAAGKLSVNPSGQIMLDGACFSQDAIDKNRATEQDGVEFRYARLCLSGEGFNIMKYKLEFDFAGDAVVGKDMFLNIGELPLIQNIQFGHFKEPYSLDELCSDKFIPFMERNLGSQLMAPSRHIGVMAHGHNEAETTTYAIGAFSEIALTDKAGANKVQSNNFGGALTMRATWLPWYDETTEGRGLLHTGIAYSYRDAFNNSWKDSYRPEAHLATEMVNGNGTAGSATSVLTDINTRNMLGAELAFVYGPFSMQSEYYINWLDRSIAPDSKTTGAYVLFSYFLTGEHRPYNRASGTFERVKPFENFFRVRDENGYVYMGKGAWELKYRFSYLDCYDGGKLANGVGGNTTGGQTAADHTIGANWYLNPYTRFMFEYIHSGIDCYTGLGVGSLDIVQMRAQIDF